MGEISTEITKDRISNELCETGVCSSTINHYFGNFVSSGKLVLGILVILNIFVLLYSGRFLFAFSNFVIILYYFRNSSNEATESVERRQQTRLGRHVLITGCDSGFGYGTAIQLNQDDVFVFAGCLTDAGVRRFKDDQTFRGLAFLMDVTKQQDVDNAKQIIEHQTGDKGLWGLVNNAGVLQPGPIEWQSVQEMQDIMNVNLWGSVSVTKTLLPLIKKAQGRIINISSMAGRVLFPHYSSYSMSKYALEAFSDGLRYEMKPWKVSVHIIEPGMFKTDILDSDGIKRKWKKVWNNQPKEISRDYGEEYYKTAVACTQDLLKKLASPNIDKVINTTCHAVMSETPKLRYSVGYDAKTLWMAVAILPTSIGDLIVSSVSRTFQPAAMERKKL